MKTVISYSHFDVEDGDSHFTEAYIVKQDAIRRFKRLCDNELSHNDWIFEMELPQDHYTRTPDKLVIPNVALITMVDC